MADGHGAGKPRNGKDPPAMDMESVFRSPSDNRRSADDIPAHPEPGVYALFAARPDCLPGITLPQSGLVYVGQSGDLAERNHFTAQDSGFSSPRRSLGALLKPELGLTAEPRSPGRSEKNYEKYRFGGDGETRLSEWMRRNLTCAIHPLDGDMKKLEKRLIKLELKKLEKRLIRKNEPPLNLTVWPNPQKQKIQALRNMCKEEAKRTWSGSA